MIKGNLPIPKIKKKQKKHKRLSKMGLPASFVYTGNAGNDIIKTNLYTYFHDNLFQKEKMVVKPFPGLNIPLSVRSHFPVK